jgi:hypothetical protein
MKHLLESPSLVFPHAFMQNDGNFSGFLINFFILQNTLDKDK